MIENDCFWFLFFPQSWICHDLPFSFFFFLKNTSYWVEPWRKGLLIVSGIRLSLSRCDKYERHAKANQKNKQSKTRNNGGKKKRVYNRRTMTTREWKAMEENQREHLEGRDFSYAAIISNARICVQFMLQFHRQCTLWFLKIWFFRASRFFQFFQTNKHKLKSGIWMLPYSRH